MTQRQSSEPNRGKEYQDGSGETYRRPAPDQDGFPHGTLQGYQWGCRDPECGCRKKNRIAMASYRARKAAGKVIPKNTRPDKAKP